MAVIDQFAFFDLEIELHAVTSGVAAHPRTQINLFAPDWSILGGGAIVEPHAGVGSLLTAMYPISAQEWDVQAKEHVQSSPVSITAWCAAARVQGGPFPPDTYRIVEATSPAAASHPRAEAVLPTDYVLIGGGAKVNWQTPGAMGNLLTASRPGMGESWVAAAKDHLLPSPATVTAFAIGLHQAFLAQLGMSVVRFRAETVDASATPRLRCGVHERQAVLVAGGAETHWNGAGSLLTGSGLSPTPGGPRPWSWLAAGKQHITADPGRITGWALALVKH